MTFNPGAELDPERLEEAVHEVGFTPTGVRAWIEGRVLDANLPAGSPPHALVFEATGTGQRFIVTTDPESDGSLDELQGAAGAVRTIEGRATKLDGVDEVVIYLEGIDERLAE